MQRRMAGQPQDDGGEQEGSRDGGERNDNGQPPRLLETALDPHQSSSWPPAISSPSSSTVADRASRSPAMPPSYITAIRSARARISSRSSLISSTPTPVAAASRRYAWTVSMLETSRPRVGDAATRTRRLPGKLPREHDLLKVPARELPGRLVGPRRANVVLVDRAEREISNPSKAQEGPARNGRAPVGLQHEVRGDAHGRCDAGAQPVFGDVRDTGPNRAARIAASHAPPADLDRPLGRRPHTDDRLGQARADRYRPLPRSQRSRPAEPRAIPR